MREEPTHLSPLTQFVRDRMQAEGYTLGEVARRANMSISTVGAYHSGQTTGDRPRRTTLERLARGLRVDAALLFDAAGIGCRDEERKMISLFRQLPTDGDRKQAIATLRAHVIAVRSRCN